jgi:Leucine-rich repeat (LRR) protein
LWHLHLLWGGKKLPTVKKEWLEPGAIFTPALQKVEYDDGSKCPRKQRSMRKSRIPAPPPQTVGSTFIRSVTLKENRLKSVPLQLFQLVNVTVIDLSENLLSSLPVDVMKQSAGGCGWDCKKLQELKLSSNKLTELPPSLWLLPELKTVTAVGNKLKKLANLPVPTVYLARALERVNLSDNKLTEVDLFLTEILSLTAIDVSSNKLETLPLKIWDLPNLEELKAGDNHLSELATVQTTGAEETDASVEADNSQPEEPEANPAMTTQVTGARAHFRPQMSRVPSLEAQKSLDHSAPLFVGGYLTSPDDTDAGNVNIVQDVSRLRKLDLSSNKFTEFPRDLPCIAPTLEELNISNNPGITHVELQFVPPSLRKFQAKACQIVQFGNVLNKTQLKRIKQSCIRNEMRMQVCQHRHHQRLVNLSSLILSQNHLLHFQVLFHEIPNTGAPDFGAEEHTYQKEPNPLLLYPSLVNLDLSHNHLLGRFNPNVAHLPKIKSIQLNNNEHLEVIPYELGHLKRLKVFEHLDLRNLPELVQPPKEVLKDSMCQQVLTYLAAGLKEQNHLLTMRMKLPGTTVRIVTVPKTTCL